METRQLFNTTYVVRQDGNVISKRGKVMKPKLTKNGYYDLNLYIAGEGKKTYRVNRLVALVYIPNPENKPFVNHIDGNKLNNSVENLEWVTHAENMEHARLTNLIKRGEDTPVSIYSTEQIEEVCAMMQAGYRNTEISESVGVGRYVIGEIRAGKSWLHVSQNYRFPKRSRSLSCETIHWLCKQIEAGLTQGEILSKTNNKIITKNIIQDIRRKRIYKDISCNYNI